MHGGAGQHVMSGQQFAGRPGEPYRDPASTIRWPQARSRSAIRCEGSTTDRFRFAGLAMPVQPDRAGLSRFRYLDSDFRAAFRPVGHPSLPPVHAADQLDNRQAEAGAAVGWTACGVGPAKPLKRVRQEVLGEPGPVILHAQGHPAGGDAYDARRPPLAGAAAIRARMALDRVGPVRSGECSRNRQRA